ncbi:hypothetical protein AB833_31165 [Chromatiales bacterium (ex Bugula neritina AB1)]|nr:hypothetical protein AB833_31165 [Chromatiales bacterium (ex Bugula neritina AB1)]
MVDTPVSNKLSAVSDLKISPLARRLTAQEKQQYERDGYVKNLPVFDSSAVPDLQFFYQYLASLLPDGTDISRINMWHKANSWCYEIARTPAILDYVDDLIGGDFYQWGGQFFVKHPHDGTRVPWHQDAQYWPLSPQKTVTVWLAFYDADESNGAMQVVKGSHRHGEFEHHINNDPTLVLEQEVAEGEINPADIVSLNLKAGEISLHDDALLHGSPANASDRIRVGMTMRYCPTSVKCDLSVWPTFESYMARGTDRLKHNPEGKVPVSLGFPVKKFQHSSEFV